MTLNQVVQRLEKIALNHKQVNHFYFGEMVEWLANGEVIYPSIFIDVSTGGIDKAEKKTWWNFDIWFCDLVNVAKDSKSNELEVQSDLTAISEDYKAMLGFTEWQQDWTIGDVSPISYYKEKFEDLVLAVKMTVAIETRYDSNRCVVPSLLNFEADLFPQNAILEEDLDYLLLE